MCTDDTDVPAPEAPAAQTFDTVADFLVAVKPGMHLCSSDFKGWGVVEAVDTDAAALVGRTNDGGRRVRVPADELVDIRGGHCVRIDRVRATLDRQNWEI